MSTVDDEPKVGTLAVEFNAISEADAIKRKQDRDRRFFVPKIRADADDVDHECDELVKKNRKNHTDEMKAINSKISSPDMMSYWSPELAKHLNEKINNSLNAYDAEKDRIDALRKQNLTELENRQLHTEIGPKGWPVPEGFIGPERQITFVPSPSERKTIVAAFDQTATGPERSEIKTAWDEAVYKAYGHTTEQTRPAKTIGDEGAIAF